MNPHTDEILEALRPRMRTARVAHVRRLVAGLLIVPILGAGAAAMARSPSITRSGAGVQPVPGPTLPDSSNVDRKAWLRNGSPSTSTSHSAVGIAPIEGAISAVSGDSRSAIPIRWVRPAR